MAKKVFKAMIEIAVYADSFSDANEVICSVMKYGTNDSTVCIEWRPPVPGALVEVDIPVLEESKIFEYPIKPLPEEIKALTARQRVDTNVR